MVKVIGPVFDFFESVKTSREQKDKLIELCQRFGIYELDAKSILEYERRRSFKKEAVMQRLRELFDKYPTFLDKGDYRESYCGDFKQFSSYSTLFLSLSKEELSKLIIREMNKHNKAPEKNKHIIRLFRNGNLLASSLDTEVKASEDIMKINPFGLFYLGQCLKEHREGKEIFLDPQLYPKRNPEWQDLDYAIRNRKLEGLLSNMTTIWNTNSKDKILTLKYHTQCESGKSDYGYRWSHSFGWHLKQDNLDLEYSYG